MAENGISYQSANTKIVSVEAPVFDITDYLSAARLLIRNGHVSPATGLLGVFLRESETNRDEAYYLLGNAYRKSGNWQLALNNYRRATDINPHSPAKEAASMLRDILSFHNKDMYNH